MIFVSNKQRNGVALSQLKGNNHLMHLPVLCASYGYVHQACSVVGPSTEFKPKPESYFF